MVLYLKSSWPYHMASISRIRFEMQTSRQMLRFGSVELFQDFSRNIQDYLLIWRKKQARLSSKQHQISRSTKLYIQEKKTSLDSSLRAPSHSDRLVFNLILSTRQMIKYSSSLYLTTRSNNFWQQLSASWYWEFMEQKNTPIQISMKWILGGYCSVRHDSKLAARTEESPLFLRTFQQNRMNFILSNFRLGSTRSLLRILSTAFMANFQSIRCESCLCLAIMKHFIYAVMRCLSFLGILSRRLTISSVFLLRLLRESLRFILAMETDLFMTGYFLICQLSVIVANAGRFLGILLSILLE